MKMSHETNDGHLCFVPSLPGIGQEGQGLGHSAHCAVRRPSQSSGLFSTQMRRTSADFLGRFPCILRVADHV